MGIRSISGVLFYTYIVANVSLNEAIFVSLLLNILMSSKGILDPGFSQYILTKKSKDIFSYAYIKFLVLVLVFGCVVYVLTENIIFGIFTIYFQNIIFGGIVYNYLVVDNRRHSQFFILWQVLGFLIVIISLNYAILRYLMLLYTLPYILLVIRSPKIKLDSEIKSELWNYMRPIFLVSVVYFVYGISERIVFEITNNRELNIAAQFFNYILAIMTLIYTQFSRVYVVYRDEADEYIRKYSKLLTIFPTLLLIAMWGINTYYFDYNISYILSSLLFGSLMVSIFLLQMGYVRDKTKLIGKIQLITLLISILVVLLAFAIGYQDLNLLVVKLLMLQVIQIVVYARNFGWPMNDYGLLFKRQILLASVCGLILDVL